jgi:hypothetical protein
VEYLFQDWIALFEAAFQEQPPKPDKPGCAAFEVRRAPAIASQQQT